MSKQQQRILDLLLPKTRASLLRILFNKPKKRRSVRELARLSHAALSTIQEELGMLVATGLIVATPWKNGCRRFYQANGDHVLFLCMLGLVHGTDRVRPINISNLRRVRRRKWKKKKAPEPVYWRPPMRPSGSMYTPHRRATG
jgi:hypothetical protein